VSLKPVPLLSKKLNPSATNAKAQSKRYHPPIERGATLDLALNVPFFKKSKKHAFKYPMHILFMTNK